MSWIPHDLKAEKIVFLPDACPGKSPMPTGTAVFTRQPSWRKFAISDCGCGMRLLRSEVAPADLDAERWDRVADLLRANKGRLGDLGGGNHFLDALMPYDEGPLCFLIHTGSRHEAGHVDDLIDDSSAFDVEFSRIVDWAAANRAKIHEALEQVFGRLELQLDMPHNTYELMPEGGVIIRKGAVHVIEGDTAIIPSHMTGDAVLVTVSGQVSDILDSLSHGTGRTMSRSECKPQADAYDWHQMRENVLIASGIKDASLRTDGPYAYRDLDRCLALLEGYVTTETRYAVVAYIGHL